MEMQPMDQQPSASPQAGLSKNVIIAISVIIGGVLVIGLAVGLGVGLGVGLNDVETSSASTASKSIVEDASTPASTATSISGTSTITTNDPAATTSIATSVDGTSTIISSGITLPTRPATTVIQETATTPQAKTKEMKNLEATTSASAGTDTTASTMAPYFNTSQCEIIVSDICYWSNFVSHDYDYDYENGHFINFTEAQQICADKASVPAYFPTELVYNKTVGSLRVKIIAEGRNYYDQVYTGVMIDGQTFEVTYPDTEVYMKWYPGDPSWCTDCTSVILVIDQSYHDINQGMRNYRPSRRVNGVVCQNNLN